MQLSQDKTSVSWPPRSILQICHHQWAQTGREEGLPSQKVYPSRPTCCFMLQAATAIPTPPQISCAYKYLVGNCPSHRISADLFYFISFFFSFFLGGGGVRERREGIIVLVSKLFLLGWKILFKSVVVVLFVCLFLGVGTFCMFWSAIFAVSCFVLVNCVEVFLRPVWPAMWIQWKVTALLVILGE